MFGILRNIGTAELLIIAVLVLLFFGGKKLSEFAQGLNQSKKEFTKIKEELKKPEDKKGDSTGGGS
jgi:sec-independent protein translocase protein TatA